MESNLLTVLMVLEHDYPSDNRVEKEIATLTNNNYRIILACATRTGKDETEEKGNLTIIRKKMTTFVYKSSVGSLKFPFYFNFWQSFLKNILNNYKINIIHIHDLPLTGLALKIREKTGIPFIFDAHENYPYMLEASDHTKTFFGKLLSSNKQWLDYEKKMLKAADIVISVIEEQKKRFINMGVDRDKIYIVSNTPQLLDIEPNIRQTSEIVFVYAGMIYTSKGIGIMINGFKKAVTKVPEARLWIIGDISKWNAKYRMIDYSDEKLIKCLGWQSHDNLLKLISASDIALLPHLKNKQSDQTIPNKLFQYMMAGKPIISSNCNPIARIIEETDVGLIYDYNNSDELAEKMIHLAQNKNLRNEMGQRGKAAVINKYNWNQEEASLLEAYKRITDLSLD